MDEQNKILIEQLETFLKDEFSRNVLTGSIRVLEDEQNPIRAHLFALGIRVLFEHHLELLAPDDEVVKCSWFKPITQKGNPSRRQRALYTTQGGLSDNFLTENLDLEPKGLHASLTKTMDELGKRVHIRPSTTILSESQITGFATDILKELLNFFTTIADCHTALVEALEIYLFDEIDDAVVNGFFENVDRISTHHAIEGQQVDDITVVLIDSERIHLNITGSAYVELQWGSSSDFRNGDGAQMNEYFPYSCKAYAPVDDPTKLEIEEDPQLDTSSWENAKEIDFADIDTSY